MQKNIWQRMAPITGEKTEKQDTGHTLSTSENVEKLWPQENTVYRLKTEYLWFSTSQRPVLCKLLDVGIVQ